MNRFHKLAAILLLFVFITSQGFSTAADKNLSNGRATVKADDLKEWLTYLASDELEGRNTFSEGLGIAAAYIAQQLKSWGVKPGAANGSYFQRVAVLGVKSDNKSTLTVEANGQTRTFNNKEGITFPANIGGKRTFTADQIEFLGYGINAPNAPYNDYAGKDLRGKVVVWMGQSGPKAMASSGRRVLFGRSREAITQGAVASIGVQGNFPGGGGGGQGQPGAANNPDAPDFTVAEKLDKPVAPAVSANDEFFEFLLSGADVKYAELKDLAAKGEPLPKFTLKNVKLTFNLNADYRIVRTQYTRNVVGIIEGSDPKLKDTYVAYGAHYDHVGYSEAEIKGGKLARGQGRITEGANEDRIWNGADDDGSGTVGILGVAKAFATGPKPKRSIIFVWHTGEEKGLWGSRYYVDFPTVPIEKIVAQVNIDMIGRNRDNKAEESNVVYAVGSDRISSEFHNITIDANNALAKPLALNYEYNDPSDSEQIYYRSDHYSYAAKGVPIIFLTTALHPDYHANTDSPEKIEYDKMAHISQYAYEIGKLVANSDKAPARDNKGPRFGKGSSGKLSM